jgi:cobyrinic acid a,c-diamide synthase
VSVPRVLLAPTHHTELADALAAALAQIMASEGEQVRYHHLGPLPPASAWDRWEGTSFLDLGLYDEGSLLSLYDVATRGATMSLLSSSRGILDTKPGAQWLPRDISRVLDCPIVVVLDCRGWGTGIRVIAKGLKAELEGVDLAGALLTGVSDGEHQNTLRATLLAEGIPTLGALFDGDSLGWDAEAPGPWEAPLETSFVDSVSRMIDIPALKAIAGQRGFLSPQNRISDRGEGGPLIAVAGGQGFTPWSRDSIEVLRAAGARVRRLDLIEDEEIPEEAGGLILAGTVWPASFTDIALNRDLLLSMRSRISGGLPTIAMGGGMIVLLGKVQDTLGRTVELADVLPAEGEILWDLDEPTYVEVTAERDSLLLGRGQRVIGWVNTEADIHYPAGRWSPPFTVRGLTSDVGQTEGAATTSLLCARFFVHFAALPDMAERFVTECAAYVDHRPD